MKRTTFCLTLFATALSLASGAPPAKGPLTKPKGAPKSTASAAKMTRKIIPNAFIVELTGDHVIGAISKTTGVAMGKLDSHQSLVAQNRARVAQEQAALRPALEARGVKVRGSVDLVMNAMFVSYSGKREDLAALPGVKQVFPVTAIMKKHLDRAVGLTQVSNVWSLVGGQANAGAGMKIGILDEGIDIVHPGFNDAGFKAPAGYPIVDASYDTPYTNNKVIVARSYSNMISLEVDGYADADPTAQDHSGHGTALAMTAAGVSNITPYGNVAIAGAAPGAYLGVYRIWNTNDDYTTNDADIQAINDAVSDGMDVINLSFGSIYASRFDQDPLVQALETAYAAGTMSVVSAGNSGPDFTTLGSPATAPHSIAVGASSNDRAFGPAVWAPYVGTFGFWNLSASGSWVLDSGDGPEPATPITAPLVDANAVGNPLGCNAFNTSLSGSIVIIARGTCTFAVKIANAQAAGAVAALISDTQADTDAGNLLLMTTGSTLPSQSIDYYSAAYITQQLAYTPFSITMGFNLCGDTSYSTPCPFSVTPNLLTGFSSAGPGVDLSVKPEVVAPGENMSMATQSYDSSGDMYDASGYVVADGTSFSTPFTAGIYALVKAAHPGLTTAQYRSMVINTAKQMLDPNGNYLSTSQIGVGLVNGLSAYQSSVVASPDTLGLGMISSSPQVSQPITLTNIGLLPDTYTLSAQSLDGILQPIVPTTPVAVPAGQSQSVTVQFNGSNLAPGAYQGYVVATSSASGAKINIPYWLDVPSTTPGNILLFYAATDSYRNQPLLDAFDFRLTDLAGAPLNGVTPVVTVVSGGGKITAVNSADAANAGVVWDTYGDIIQDVPGLWTVDVVLGPASGNNVFQITAGNLSYQITITGCRTYNFFGDCLL